MNNTLRRCPDCGGSGKVHRKQRTYKTIEDALDPNPKTPHGSVTFSEECDTCLGEGWIER